MKSDPVDMDSYIAGFPEHTQKMLEQMRETIRKAAPDATETISYAIPTYKYYGNMVHFAGYERHIGFYPGSSGIEHFKNEFSGYKFAKGSVQFPLSQPLPLDLVTRMVLYCVERNRLKAEKKQK